MPAASRIGTALLAAGSSGPNVFLMVGIGLAIGIGYGFVLARRNKRRK
ncbi:LPXTG cell wall anchor domain-containing protein [Kitasatospora viridis]|nr:LPXTG cell wall anchor domain-containing protein [Kitasatospora viridis]